MHKCKDNLQQNNDSICFFFDSKYYGIMYGYEIMKLIFKESDLKKNKENCAIFHGDLSDFQYSIDIFPYTINDKLCTVNFKHQFKDWPFVVAFMNMDIKTCQKIDKRLKIESVGYIGMSRIGTTSIDKKKLFWKNLPITIAIKANKMIYLYDYGCERTDTFYEELAKQNGYQISSELLWNYKIALPVYIDKKIKKMKTEPLVREILKLNFSLNSELQIAGSLIWESVENLARTNFASWNGEKLCAPLENGFSSLYFAAQGIERLQKIVINLLCRLNNVPIKDEIKLAELLYSHSHKSLDAYIKGKWHLITGKLENKLLELLDNFYTKERYVNFSDKESNIKKIFHSFNTEKDFCKCNHSIYSNFGSALGKYSRRLYSIICDVSTKLNIFTYELESDMHATLVFWGEDENLYNKYKKIDISKKELFYYLIKNTNVFPKRYLKKISLDFDPKQINSFISEILLNRTFSLYDEVDTLYDEICNKINIGKRIKYIDCLIGNDWIC